MLALQSTLIEAERRRYRLLKSVAVERTRGAVGFLAEIITCQCRR